MSTLIHVCNRGVEGRDLFLDSSDYVRFVHNLYEFNDRNPAPQSDRRPGPNVGSPTSNIRERLVDIHGWCLMKNHYHLLLSEKSEGALTLFLRKLNTGYANYFNARYERSGTLFQGKTKRVMIKRQAHFLYILHYIHLNPLDYFSGEEDWRVRSKGSISDTAAALAYLKIYRWSSYLDYAGIKNFPSILTTSLFKESLGDPQRALVEYLSERVIGLHALELE